MVKIILNRLIYIRIILSVYYRKQCSCLLCLGDHRQIFWCRLMTISLIVIALKYWLTCI